MGNLPVPQRVFVSQQKKKKKVSFPACAFQLVLRKSQAFRVSSCGRVTQGRLGYEAKVSSSQIGGTQPWLAKGEKENNFHSIQSAFKKKSNKKHFRKGLS